MEIRYITNSDDRLAISKIYEESWKYAYKGIIPQEYLNSIPEGRRSKNFDIPGWKTLVCIVDGKYIGTSSFCKSRFEQFPDCGEIISIYFLPEYMGKGYGKKLLETSILELKKLGFDELFLWVLDDNIKAKNFYEHLGFLQTEEYLDDTIGGKEFREVRFIYKNER